MSRLLVCSDIHGQYDAWMKALDVATFRPEKGDRLVVIGDIMDRGPKSKECFFFLHDLIQAYPKQIKYIRGNHEEMFLDYLKADTHLNRKLTADHWFRNGGWETVQSFLKEEFNDMDHTYENIQQTLLESYQGLREYLEALPHFLLQDDAIFVHAGLYPHLPLRNQAEKDMLWIREEFFYNYEPVKGDVLEGLTVVHGHTPVWAIPNYQGTGIHQGRYSIGIDGGSAAEKNIFLVEWPTLETVIVPIKSLNDWDIHQPNDSSVRV